MLVTTEGRGLRLPGEKKEWVKYVLALGHRMYTVKDIRLDLGGRTSSLPPSFSVTSGLGSLSISCLGQKSVSHPGSVLLPTESNWLCPCNMS